MIDYLFSPIGLVAVVIVGIFAVDMAKRWWRENEWRRQRRRERKGHFD